MPQRPRARRRAKKRARRRLRIWRWREWCRKAGKLMGDYIRSRLYGPSICEQIFPVISVGGNPPAEHIEVAFDIETWKLDPNALHTEKNDGQDEDRRE